MSDAEIVANGTADSNGNSSEKKSNGNVGKMATTTTDSASSKTSSPASSPRADSKNDDEQQSSNVNSESKDPGSDKDGKDSPTASSPSSSTSENKERSPEYHKLVEYGLDSKVAVRLDEIYKTGKLSHADLDQRALDALKEFPPEGALGVLAQFLESNLEHVSNKSAFLCGVMKTYRRMKATGGTAASAVANGANASANGVKGPDEEKIKEILERTGYTLDVTTGQRKYGGPPPGWEGEPPSSGCEVFCGKIPRDMYESELIPLFEKCGEIWDLRLMMDPMTGLNRGYAFVTFTTRDAAQEAVRQLDNYEIGEAKNRLKVNVSEPKTRLFIGNIPKSKGRDEIQEEFNNMSAGLREVIIYSSPDDKKKNRGFCFLEYESHKAASLAKRRLETGRVKVWSCDIIVDWADPQEEPDVETMSQVKVLYVRNLTAAVTEEKIREVFEVHGKVDRVKKIKDYAFVHFEDRDKAVEAMEAMNKTNLMGSNLEISLAKPPSDKKKKEEMLRKREARMMRTLQTTGMSFQMPNLATGMGMMMPQFPPFPTAYPQLAPGMGGGIYPGHSGGRGGSHKPRQGSNQSHHQQHHHSHHHGNHQGGHHGQNRGGAGAPVNNWNWGIPANPAAAAGGGWGGDSGWRGNPGNGGGQISGWMGESGRRWNHK